jgi:hypothetical protein
MDPESWSADDGLAEDGAAPGQVPEPTVLPASGPAQTPESPGTGGVVGFALPGGPNAPQYPGQPPQYGQPLPGQPPQYGQPLPAQPTGWSGRRKAILAAAVAVAVLIVAGIVIAVGFIGPIAATVSEKLITPAPERAGGLVQQNAVERGASFQAIRVRFRNEYGAKLQGAMSSYTIALYKSAAGADSTASRLTTVLYIGFNSRTIENPSSEMNGLIGGITGTMTDVRSESVAAGPGGGTAKCLSGESGGESVSVCAWTTARTIGVILTPARQASTSRLATLMRQMRPDLQRG